MSCACVTLCYTVLYCVTLCYTALHCVTLCYTEAALHALQFTSGNEEISRHLGKPEINKSARERHRRRPNTKQIQTFTKPQCQRFVPFQIAMKWMVNQILKWKQKWKDVGQIQSTAKTSLLVRFQWTVSKLIKMEIGIQSCSSQVRLASACNGSCWWRQHQCFKSFARP